MTTASRSGPLVIAVAGLKGGIAKTTTAIHIAGVLASAQQRVLLADGDRIRTSTAWARGGHLPFTVAPVTALARARDYDVVVLDTEGGPDNTELLEFARTADLTLLPTTPDINGLDGVAQTADILRAGGVASERYSALLTMVRPGGMKEIQARKGLLGQQIPVLRSSVRISEVFRDAANAAVLVKDVRADIAAKCWKDYEAVTAEVIARVMEVNA
ncbi:ParA family protein [Deinococcus sp. KSM4-11]|uniref:ParA family protein n=1 Tax=Deinococcus sp. KSM4-11 TaxID=2568654 RepID=UPI0010A434A8|nr:ParA family protein [Deinococcus sp. KSM4-11]THF84294.1 ParA family protein [Deinococcus sp. KSM4-11]